MRVATATLLALLASVASSGLQAQRADASASLVPGERERFASIVVWSQAPAPPLGYVEVSGRVERIQGRALILASGVTVDTSAMRDNPLDERAHPRVRLGDRIKVGGSMRTDSFGRTALFALWITRIGAPKLHRFARGCEGTRIWNTSCEAAVVKEA